MTTHPMPYKPRKSALDQIETIRRWLNVAMVIVCGLLIGLVLIGFAEF